MNNFKLNPYYLGLWLGDGSSDDTSVTTMDNEIKEFLYDYAKSLNLKVRVKSRKGNKSSTYYITAGKPGYTTKVSYFSMDDGRKLGEFNSMKEAADSLGINYPSNISAACSGKSEYCKNFFWKKEKTILPNHLLKSLKDLNLIKNKHFPDSIFEESEEYLLDVLAGFIDSDGTKLSSHRITIAQKNYLLIEGLSKLCEKVNLNYKIRSKCIKFNGLDYHYNNITIWGDNLLKCNIKIQRKKILNKNK